MEDQTRINDLGSELRTVVSALNRRYRSQRPPGELGEAAMSVLLRLQKSGPQTLTDLSAVARVSLGSMSQIIRRLEELDYVARTPDPQDGRRVLLSASQAGFAVAEEVRSRLENWFDEQLGQLSPEETERLDAALPVLRRLAEPTDR